ncbi:hypothetical protein ES703_25103 [subsurface metagenome]
MNVVIVGAGPAGLITALNLLQRGIKPLILEKSPEIRATACGEALGLRWINEVPFDSSPYIAKRVRGAKLIFPGGSVDHIDKECAVLDRTKWLRGMAEEVERGGELRLNSEVIAVTRDSIRLKNGENIGYQVLIGADGPHSRLARYLGMKYNFVTASQYKIACNTSAMDFLEFYFDKRFSYGYAWIFPKDGVINVGTGGDFAHLDAFLKYKGLDSHQIIKREAGIIPASGIGKLVQRNIALIGDAASMPNPTGLSGLAPIIQASQILARNINSLENYETEVKNHPMANSILLKGGHILMNLSNQDLANIGKFFAGVKKSEGRAPKIRKIVKYPSLLLKLNRLRTVYKAGVIAMGYGW